MTALTGHPDPAAAAGAKRDLLLRLVRGGAASRPSGSRKPGISQRSAPTRTGAMIRSR